MERGVCVWYHTPFPTPTAQHATHVSVVTASVARRETVVVLRYCGTQIGSPDVPTTPPLEVLFALGYGQV